MTKFIILIAFICTALVAAGPRGGSGGPGGSGGRGGPRGSNQTSSATLQSKVCANSTVAQSFLTSVQAVITQLTNNGSFTDFLQLNAQRVAYFQNSSNADLLTSNCTAFFTGLNAANVLDKTANQQRRQYIDIAKQLYATTVANVTGVFPDHSGEKF